MLAETVVAAMAVAKLGAIFLPVFSGYGAEAIAVRLQDAGAKALVCADGFLRRGSRSPMVGRPARRRRQVDIGRDLVVVPRVAPVAEAGRPARRRRGVPVPSPGPPADGAADPSTASTRCSSPTRRAPPAGPRGPCTSTAGSR